MKKVHLLLLFPLIIAGLIISLPAKAATFKIILDKDVFAIGDTINADIKIDSEGIGINAAQATVTFPKDILEVLEVSKDQGIFNFWLQDPTFSNTDGTITFVGGSTSGLTGASLKTFSAKLKIKGAGSGSISVTDGAITASDGNGTNVFSSTQGVTITTVRKEDIIVVAPPQIRRSATEATRVPPKPAIEIPLYPKPNQWYNISQPFLVKFVLTSDITEISSVLNKESSSIPQKSEGLIDNKTFPALSDGTWYLHVQYKNNLGWGDVNHYKIMIDTAPPIPFDVSITSGNPSDNPTPEITYKSVDQLSGLEGYFLRIGQGDIFKIADTAYSLPLQAPGKRIVKVLATDKAGNSTESSVELDVLPITSPIISQVTNRAFVGEGKIDIAGTSQANSKIHLVLKTSDGLYVQDVIIDANDNGSWKATIEHPLNKGNYFIEAVASDSRGALSSPVTSETIKVRVKPLLSIGSFSITPAGLLTVVILGIFVGLALAYFKEKQINSQRKNKIIIAQRDVAALLSLIEKDVEEVLVKYRDGKIDPREAQEIKISVQKVKENIKKASKYILENIGEIG